MKLDENKHDHKLTNWLKVGIFALLMLAPLFASISQTLYVTFNKNAYQSYSNKQDIITQYQSNEVNDISDLVEGNAYTFTYDETLIEHARIGISKILLNENLTYYQFSLIGTNYDTTIRINWNNSGTKYDVASITPLNNNQNAITQALKIDFIYGNTQYNQNLVYMVSSISKCENLPISYIENEEGTLDNAFYYGVDQMTKSDLFNWTQNTALYTGINAMTTQLEIQTPAIAILLTYWFILTIIYVIIDIVLKGFTLLTHMFSNKV